MNGDLGKMSAKSTDVNIRKTYTLGMDRTQICIFKQADQICLDGFLKSTYAVLERIGKVGGDEIYKKGQILPIADDWKRRSDLKS